MPRLKACYGLIPFLIDWGDSPHPSATVAAGCRLISLEVQHPNPKEVNDVYKALNITLAANNGDSAMIFANVDTPQGVVNLR